MPTLQVVHTLYDVGRDVFGREPLQPGQRAHRRPAEAAGGAHPCCCTGCSPYAQRDLTVGDCAQECSAIFFSCCVKSAVILRHMHTHTHLHANCQRNLRFSAPCDPFNTRCLQAAKQDKDQAKQIYRSNRGQASSIKSDLSSLDGDIADQVRACQRFRRGAPSWATVWLFTPVWAGPLFHVVHFSHQLRSR